MCNRFLLLVVLAVSLCFSLGYVQAQRITVSVDQRGYQIGEPITISGVDGFAPLTRNQYHVYVFIFPGIGCAGMDSPWIKPVFTATPLVNIGGYNVTLSAGLPSAGTYSAAALDAVAGEYACQNFEVVPHYPVSEFSGTTVMAFVAVAASLYVMRRKAQT